MALGPPGLVVVSGMAFLGLWGKMTRAKASLNSASGIASGTLGATIAVERSVPLGPHLPIPTRFARAHGAAG